MQFSFFVNKNTARLYNLYNLFLWPMLPSVVAVTIVTHCSRVCQSTIHESCNIFRTMLHRLFPIQIGILGSVLFLHWLPVEQQSIFKTVTFVYRFLHAGVSKYFGLNISPQQSIYNTRHGQNQGCFPVV